MYSLALIIEVNRLTLLRVVDILKALNMTKKKKNLHILLAYFNLAYSEKHICAIEKPSLGKMQIL